MTFSDDLNFGPNVEGRAEPYGGVGDELRLLREQQGHTLGDVAETLRISARYLQAIEEGDLGKRTVESIIVHHADFVSFEPFKA